MKRVCGVLGTIRLIEGQYLLVATHRVYVGMIKDSVIWRLVGYDIIPYHDANASVSPIKEQLHNQNLLKMLRKVLDTPYLYFSYSYPLSHTVQRQQSIPLQRRVSGDGSHVRFLNYSRI